LHQKRWVLYPESGAFNDIWKEIRKNPEFWLNIPPLIGPDEVARLNELSRKESVRFVTQRDCKDGAQITTEWLERLGINSPIVYQVDTAEQKARFGVGLSIVTIAIEDNGATALLMAMINPQGTVYILNRPYNDWTFSIDPRPSNLHWVYSFGEFLRILGDRA